MTATPESALDSTNRDHPILVQRLLYPNRTSTFRVKKPVFSEKTGFCPRESPESTQVNHEQKAERKKPGSCCLLPALHPRAYCIYKGDL